MTASAIHNPSDTVALSQGGSRVTDRRARQVAGSDRSASAADQFLATHPLRDHRRDAVVAHGDAVERVGDLHRRLLVGDDDQLGDLTQLLEQADEPPQVDVVERGLDLVHHVERRRPGPEDRHQHRHRRQRLLATGQQREPLDLLAGRARLDLDAGGQHVVGVGEQQPALAAGEQRGEHLGELAFHVGVGLGEHLQDAVVDVGDDVEQILARALDVLELGRQEVVALLQRGELLERQWVDPAQFGEFTLGLLGPALLGGPVERHRRGRGHLLAALLGLLVLGHLQLGRRQRRRRARTRRRGRRRPCRTARGPAARAARCEAPPGPWRPRRDAARR